MQEAGATSADFHADSFVHLWPTRATTVVVDEEAHCQETAIQRIAINEDCFAM